ncbi:hypothetical protein ACPEEZ_14760 [Frigoribacterium sp. 2-23]|uniref:hypothetical protein n=1 Tax=Frigoribacterium sp. 2-23 TaxID=3415006 RepID=UPI003C6F2337
MATVDDDEDGDTVTTEGGRRLRADLLVIAEGVRSRTRASVFGDDIVEERDLDVTMVFGTIPRTERDDDRWRSHTALRGRQVHLRPDPYGTIRAIRLVRHADGRWRRVARTDGGIRPRRAAG